MTSPVHSPRAVERERRRQAKIATVRYEPVDISITRLVELADADVPASQCAKSVLLVAYNPAASVVDMHLLDPLHYNAAMNVLDEHDRISVELFEWLVDDICAWNSEWYDAQIDAIKNSQNPPHRG